MCGSHSNSEPQLECRNMYSRNLAPDRSTGSGDNDPLIRSNSSNVCVGCLHVSAARCLLHNTHVQYLLALRATPFPLPAQPDMPPMIRRHRVSCLWIPSVDAHRYTGRHSMLPGWQPTGPRKGNSRDQHHASFVRSGRTSYLFISPNNVVTAPHVCCFGIPRKRTHVARPPHHCCRVTNPACHTPCTLVPSMTAPHR